MKREARFWSESLRVKFALIVTFTLVILLGALTGLQYINYRDNNLNSLSLIAAHVARVIENDLRHRMMEADPEGIQDLLTAIGQLPEIEKVYLLNTDGQVVFASEPGAIGLRLDNSQSECQGCHLFSAEDRPRSIVVDLPDGGEVFRSMQPIENEAECKECHDPGERLLGVLLTDVSIRPFRGTLQASLLDNVLWSGGAILITLVVVVSLVNGLVLRRLDQLLEAITSFGQGGQHQPVRDDQRDEIGRISWAFDEMAQQVKEREAENYELSQALLQRSNQRGELLRRLITAQEDERKRVARELHDELGQSITGLAFRVKLMEQQLGSHSTETRQQLDTIRTMISETAERMYDMILDLRPSALDEIGLVPALRSHASRVLEDTELSFQIEATELRRRLPPEIETAIFRVFQEAINNTLRHAGASHVKITLGCNNTGVHGMIVDDGIGFEPESIRRDGESPRGLGLLGMEERVSQCGGHLRVESARNRGTTIHVHIPLEEPCG